MRIIEVNGTKMEIDERTATVIENYRVGDPVRLLLKKWNDNFESHPAVIIGFDGFKNRPTIRVLYVESTGEMSTTDIYEGVEHEIAPRDKTEHLLNRGTVMDKLDKKVEKIESDLETAKEMRRIFVERFDKFFEAEEEEATA